MIEDIKWALGASKQCVGRIPVEVILSIVGTYLDAAQSGEWA
jgi:hypothetical protein